MFARFFKPKWQHRNPAKRMQAAAEMSLEDPVLTTLAQGDKAAEVRAVAIGRIRDLVVLRKIVDREQNSRVLMKARSRLRDLLCGNVEGSPPLSERLATLDSSLGAELMMHIARHGREADLRRRALAWIDDPKLLTDVTAGDQAIDVRIAAVGRIRDIETLEQVVKSSRKSDKRVTQLARQRLTRLRERQECKQRGLALRKELESLCDAGSFTDRQKGLLKAEREWPALKDSTEKSEVEPIEKALTRLREICAHYRKAKTAKRRASEILRETIEDLKDREEYSEASQQRIQVVIADAQALWEGQDSLEPLDEQSLSRRYRQALEHVAEQQRRLHGNSLSARNMREFLEQCENDAEAGKYTTKTSLGELKEAWDALPRPKSEKLVKELNTAFQQLYDLVERRRIQAAASAKKLEQILTEMVDHLHRAVDEGQLNEAISLRDQIRHRIDSALNLLPADRSRFERALKASAPRIRELQSWRNWGASGVRERLCEQAEGLLDTQHSAPDLADRIRKLRETWKRLDRQSGPAAEAIWERFNTACNQAYEPCRIAFEEEAKQREHNLLQKDEICAALEKLYAETDWDQVRWRELIKNYNKLCQSWRRIGPISRAKGKQVSKRFKKACDRIETHLDQQRQAGLQLRRQLVEQVEKLAEESDLELAIGKAKRAQAEWNRVIVRASRKIEQDLWESFRAACDKVFERRNAVREAQRQTEETVSEKRIQLIATLEKMVQRSIEEADTEIDAQVERIKQEWAELDELPKQHQQKLEQRFQGALESYHHATERLQHSQAQQLWDALQKRGDLCARLESQLEQPATPQEIETVNTAWQALPELADDQIHDVQSRFAAVLSALNGDTQTRTEAVDKLKANATDKRLQCLQMEVMAGVTSPPEYADQRMELKVTQLSERFEGQDNRISNSAYQAAMDMQRLWVASGMLPADEMAALQKRFSSAARVLLEGK